MDALSSRKRAAAFFAQGQGKGVRLLTKILEEARARGEIDLPDCARAADCFIGIAHGNLFFERVLQLRAPPDAKEIEDHIQTAVDIFLNAPGVIASSMTIAPRKRRHNVGSMIFHFEETEHEASFFSVGLYSLLRLGKRGRTGCGAGRRALRGCRYGI
jgi:GNAT superfamily N-acetyltransferase